MKRTPIPGWIVLSALLLAACSGGTAFETPLTPVTIEPVRKEVPEQALRYSASLIPRTQVALAFRVGGYVAAISQRPAADGRMRTLQAGDEVAGGALLASLRETEYAARVQAAEAQLASALAALQQARRDAGRSGRLFAVHSLTKTELDATETRLEMAEAAADAARSQVAEARTALGDCTLRAPMRAVVLARQVEIGTLVAPGTPAFVLADTSAIKAVFGVPDVIVGDLAIGRPQPVQTEALPGTEFPGLISAIAPSADPATRLFEVEVTIPNPDGRLRSGMIASLELAVRGPVAPVTVVPLGAIVRAPGEAEAYAVFLVVEEDGAHVARLRRVEIGDVFGNTIAVSAGVQPGDRVVVAGATVVRDGERVRVVP